MANRIEIMNAVLDAMQAAEEIDGPEGVDYLHLMNQIRKEAETRMNAYYAHMYERNSNEKPND